MEGQQAIRTDVPARLDRLPWSRFHWLVVVGARHHLDPRRARGHPGGLGRRRRCRTSPRLHLTAAAGRPHRQRLSRSARSLGALFFGHLTDRLGRKKLFTVTLGVYLVGDRGDGALVELRELRCSSAS